MEIKLIIYAGDSTYNPVIYEGTFPSRKAAEKFVAANYPNDTPSFDEVYTVCKPTNRNIHKALW